MGLLAFFFQNAPLADEVQPLAVARNSWTIVPCAGIDLRAEIDRLAPYPSLVEAHEDVRAAQPGPPAEAAEQQVALIRRDRPFECRDALSVDYRAEIFSQSLRRKDKQSNANVLDFT